MGSNSYMVELRNVTLRFGEKTVFDAVSLTVDPQERLVIIGQSGAGKTTILRLILGILEPTVGSVFSTSSRSRDLRRAISNVPACASAWFIRTRRC